MTWRLARPVLHALDAERAHRWTLHALQAGLAPASRIAPDPILRRALMGLDFAHPLGLAAGFDKNAEVPDAMLRLGFAFTEIGSVTPKPQAGNPKPRLFRLAEDRAVINRMGFNGEGLDAAEARLNSRGRRGVVGANVGANKDSADRDGDYAIGAARLAPHVDYLVCNVSSPNTPGLRDLQGKARLAALLARVREALRGRAIPILIKIAPDLADDDIADAVEVALTGGAAGLIVGNTTIQRPATLKSPHRGESGGLSGAPLREIALRALTVARRAARGRLVLVGCGGIASPADAYARIKAGADLLQLYSALIYEGPGLITRIVAQLPGMLRADGFTSIAEAVGQSA